jgi:hypothetical protein
MIIDCTTELGKHLMSLLYAEGTDSDRIGHGQAWNRPKFTMRELIKGAVRFWVVEDESSPQYNKKDAAPSG